MTNPQDDFDPQGLCEFDDVIAWAARTPPPPEVVAKARLLLLDSIGCIAAGLRHDEVRRIGASLAPLPGDGRLPGGDAHLGPAGCAALGAAAMCWDEANEGLAQAHGRPPPCRSCPR